MADQHNKDRYGEVWDQKRIRDCLFEIEKIKDYVVLSGGWAWHFMSPPFHIELKHAHDHKDIDIFVKPEEVWILIDLLNKNGFKKVKTRYDKLPSEEDFRRYEKRTIPDLDGKSTKITIDFFVKEVPFVEVFGWKVVEPECLIGFYSTIHSSSSCFAVVAAKKFMEQGISPVLREELVAIPK